MASALSELTGQAFYTVKSTHQDGSDVRSAPHNLFKIGLEGKRYKPSTRLSLDELLYKITDASRAQTPVDLWILATTRPVDVSDREKLHDYGESYGIGVIVLDWPDDLAQLRDLAVLCASATDTCKRFLKPTEPLTEALNLIRQDSNFGNVRSQLLDQLTRADTGYESTRRAVERWMVQAQASLANAQSRLGGHHNLGGSEHGVVPRTAINTQLNDWYAGSQGVVALLGDEGMGKSWAALDWYNRLKTSETGALLTVFLSAKSIDTSDVKLTLAKALATQTGVRSSEFWEKRLALWERSGRNDVRMLIFVDGLNENFEFTAWADWLQPLFEDQLGGMYRVIVSCWPNWWHGTLAGLMNLTPEPSKITIEGFNEAELDELLIAMGVKRSDFAKAVLELMRTPRLSSLVAKHREKLKDSGDVTAERVIYEDWKDRLAHRGSRAGLTDVGMRSFVTELGEKLRTDIDQAMVTRKDVIDNLSAKSGKSSLELMPAVTELSSGAWLQRSDKPDTFKVAADRIPFVLGATLMSHLREETGAAVIEAEIAEFLDPLKAHRLGAAILRAATTIALLDADPSPVVRKTLLSRWLDEQNFHADDFEAFWRIAGLDPDLFLNFAEARWLAREGSSLSDEVLIKGFAKAADFHNFKAALRERLMQWLSTAWPAPKVGAVLGKVDQTQPDSQQRADETRSRYEQWVSGEVAQSFAPVRLDTDKDKDWSWLSPRALAILSYVERAPFVDVLVAWALSRAIMQWARHREEVAWLLRVNLGDTREATDAIRSAIMHLKAQQNSICEQAVAYLAAAISHVERGSVPLEVDRTPQKALPTPLDVTGMDATALYEETQRYLSPFAWREYDPESGATLINALVERALDANEAVLNLLLNNLADLLLILTPNSRTRLRAAIAATLDAIRDESEADKLTAAGLKAARLTLELYDAEPVDQSALILSHGIGADPGERLPLYRSITFRDISTVELKRVPAKHLALWLDYVGASLAKEEIAELEFLSELISHDDQNVRESALALAVHGHNLPALREFAASPYSASPGGEEKPNINNEFWRNSALLEICAFSPDTAISKRLSPESVALIAKHRSTDPKALEQFHTYLRGEFEAVKTEKSWSLPRYWQSHREAVDALVEYDLDAVLEWLLPWIENLARVSKENALRNRFPFIKETALVSHFPVITVMQALSAKAPEMALQLYEVLTDRSYKGMVSSDGIVMFPLEVLASKRANDLCDRLLTEATTDKALLEIVWSAHKHKRLDWLFDRIQCLEASRTPADVAKAYTLLGFCDESDRADSLWQDFLARPPLDNWLDSVLNASIDDYARNRTARDSFASFWSSDEPSAARHALKHVKETCDIRIGLWIEDIDPKWEDRPYDRRLARSLAATPLTQATKRTRIVGRRSFSIHGKLIRQWHRGNSGNHSSSHF